jgi:hypothetical protein
MRKSTSTFWKLKSISLLESALFFTPNTTLGNLIKAILLDGRGLPTMRSRVDEFGWAGVIIVAACCGATTIDRSAVFRLVSVR